MATAAFCTGAIFPSATFSSIGATFSSTSTIPFCPDASRSGSSDLQGSLGERKEEALPKCTKRRKKSGTSLQVVGLSEEKTMSMLLCRKVLNSASQGTFRARGPGNLQSLGLLLAELSNYTGLLVLLKALLKGMIW